MSSALLRLFVYGSLQRGFNNYQRFCRSVRSLEPAQIEGELYRQPLGYPVLVLPANRFLARGSADPRADLVAQELFTKQIGASGSGSFQPPRGASRVHGELLTFANPTARLRVIDRLEEFYPQRRSPYERVLIEVYSRCRQARLAAWTYVAGDLARPGRLIPGGKWRGPCDASNL